jgi:ElaB/YqjD/DUF883 family membrane-anchored ribosome-binding protein
VDPVGEKGMAERDDIAGERSGARRARSIGSTLDTMKVQAVDAARETRAQAAAAGAAAQRQVGRLGEQMRDAAETLVDEQKERMAVAVQGVADMLRRTADTLERENNATAAHYAGRVAAQIDRFSTTVREREIGEMVASTEAFARRQPALFIAGAVAAGFVLGRLLARAPQRDYAAGETYRRDYRRGDEALAGYAAGSGVGGERV